MDKTNKAALKSRAALLKSRMKGKMKMDYTTCEKTIRGYFDSAVNELIKKYDPKTAKEAAEFALILEYMENHPSEVKMPKIKDKKQVADGDVDYMDYAVDELRGAKKYYELYETTGDGRFLSMAKAELGHAAYLKAILLEQGRKQDADNIKAKLRQLEMTIR